MKNVAGFNIALWERLGFSFEVSDWFEGGQIWYAENNFDDFILSIRINTFSNRTLAKIETLQREKMGNHVVSEGEALDWFSSKSQEFRLKYQSLSS